VAFQLYRTSAAEARCTHTTFYGHLPYHERPWTDNDTIYDNMSMNEQQGISPALQEGEQQQDATGANAAANHALNRGGFQPASAMLQPNSEADGSTHRAADGSAGAGAALEQRQQQKRRRSPSPSYDDGEDSASNLNDAVAGASENTINLIQGLMQSFASASDVQALATGLDSLQTAVTALASSLPAAVAPAPVPQAHTGKIVSSASDIVTDALRKSEGQLRSHANLLARKELYSIMTLPDDPSVPLPMTAPNNIRNRKPLKFTLPANCSNPDMLKEQQDKVNAGHRAQQLIEFDAYKETLDILITEKEQAISQLKTEYTVKLRAIFVVLPELPDKAALQDNAVKMFERRWGQRQLEMLTVQKHAELSKQEKRETLSKAKLEALVRKKDVSLGGLMDAKIDSAAKTYGLTPVDGAADGAADTPNIAELQADIAAQQQALAALQKQQQPPKGGKNKPQPKDKGKGKPQPTDKGKGNPQPGSKNSQSKRQPNASTKKSQGRGRGAPRGRGAKSSRGGARGGRR